MAEALYREGPLRVLCGPSTAYQEGWVNLPLSAMLHYIRLTQERDFIRIVQNIAYNSMFNGDVRIERPLVKEDEEVIRDRSKLYKPWMMAVAKLIDAIGFAPVMWEVNNDPCTMDADPFVPVLLELSLLASVLMRIHLNGRLEWEFYPIGRDGQTSNPIQGVYVIVKDRPQIHNHQVVIVSRVAAVHRIFELSDHKIRCEQEADRRRAYDPPFTVSADSNHAMSHRENMPMPSGTGEFPNSKFCANDIQLAMVYDMALKNGKDLAVDIHEQSKRQLADAEKSGRAQGVTRPLQPGHTLAPNYHPPDAPDNTFVAMEHALGTTAQMWGIPRNAISNGNATGKVTMQGGEGETSMMNQVFIDAQSATRDFLQTETEKLHFSKYFNHYVDTMAQKEKEAAIQAAEAASAAAAVTQKSSFDSTRAGKHSTKKRIKPAIDPAPSITPQRKEYKQVERECRVTVTMPMRTPLEMVLTLHDKGWLAPDAAKCMLSSATLTPLANFVAKAPLSDAELRTKELELKIKTQHDAHTVAMTKPVASAAPPAKKAKKS